MLKSTNSLLCRTFSGGSHPIRIHAFLDFDFFYLFRLAP